MNLTRSKVLTVISILYGISIPILAISGVENVWKYAAIGGMVIGALWAITGVLGGGNKSRSGD
jgi:formate-dependent nitrite reductase membrane component NrfD